MKLEWMKTEKCPECGSTTVVEERISFSRSGRKESERRTFICEKAFVSTGPFHEECRYTCTLSKDYIEFQKKKQAIVDDLCAFLLKKGLRRSFIDGLKWHAEYDLKKEHFLPEPDDDGLHQFDGHGCP